MAKRIALAIFSVIFVIGLVTGCARTMTLPVGSTAHCTVDAP